VNVMPADASRVALPGAIAGDAVSDVIEASELLDTDVDDLAWRIALVARAGLLRFKRAQQAQAACPEDARDGGR